MFSDEQIAMLKEKLDPKNVKKRQDGRGGQLSYIEGWRVIAEANAVFGPDGWERKTEVALAWAGKRGTRSGEQDCVCYTAKVTITVTQDEQCVTRDGVGAGMGLGSTPAEAHEMACKAAETDATKRALSTFGWRFGLALYDKELENVGTGEAKTSQAPAKKAAPKSPPDTIPDPVAPELKPEQMGTTSEMTEAMAAAGFHYAYNEPPAKEGQSKDDVIKWLTSKKLASRGGYWWSPIKVHGLGKFLVVENGVIVAKTRATRGRPPRSQALDTETMKAPATAAAPAEPKPTNPLDPSTEKGKRYAQVVEAAGELSKAGGNPEAYWKGDLAEKDVEELKKIYLFVQGAHAQILSEV